MRIYNACTAKPGDTITLNQEACDLDRGTVLKVVDIKFYNDACDDKGHYSEASYICINPSDPHPQKYRIFAYETDACNENAHILGEVVQLKDHIHFHPNMGKRDRGRDAIILSLNIG